MAVRRDYRALDTDPAEIYHYPNGESRFTYRAEWRPKSVESPQEVVDTVLSGRGFSNIEDYLYEKRNTLNEQFLDQESSRYTGKLKIESSDFDLIYYFNPDKDYKRKVEFRSYEDDLEQLKLLMNKLD